MRELSASELDTIIGGTVSYPGVYLEESNAGVNSIPGVSTSMEPQRHVVYQSKGPFHHKVP